MLMAYASLGGPGIMVTGERLDSHLVPLPGAEWTVWRGALLRSSGFPAVGLDRFSVPACAAVADAFLDGLAGQEDLEAAHTAALAQARATAAEIVADPLFREALIWQSPAVAAHLASEGQATESARRRRQRKKARENAVARYWQRRHRDGDDRAAARPRPGLAPGSWRPALLQ
jgi:hypothetical protein